MSLSIYSINPGSPTFSVKMIEFCTLQIATTTLKHFHESQKNKNSHIMFFKVYNVNFEICSLTFIYKFKLIKKNSAARVNIFSSPASSETRIFFSWLEESVYVTVKHPAFCLFLYLTGVHFLGELQHGGDVSQQKIKCRPIRTREIGGISLSDVLYVKAGNIFSNVC